VQVTLEVKSTQGSTELRPGAIMFGGLAEIIGCVTSVLIVLWMANLTVAFSQELGGWCGTTISVVTMQMWFAMPLALAIPMICAVVCRWCGTRRVIARRAYLAAAIFWLGCCAATLGWAWLTS
jgi:hypothetical protein